MQNRILVGDIGGTNIRFAVAHRHASGLPSLSHIWRAPANDFEKFSDALACFLENTTGHDHPTQAVFALAGPMDKDSVSLTNKDWTVRRSDLISRFGFDRLVFMNDFAAMARSIPELSDDAFHNIQLGHPGESLSPLKTISVAGAGTGLGQALLVGDAVKGWSVLPTEGGHQPFAPLDDYERQIQAYLNAKYGYVSFELICSGRGLEVVYDAISAVNGITPADLRANDVTQRAKSGDMTAQDTCEFAANALMNFIGNTVLASGSWQGAVLAGGVSQHLLPYLSKPSAIERFTGKGKMESRMARVPLRLLIDSTAPLIGAASSS
ncbi:glucokinase [Hellea balneolensis]|uniref:glucokinase n=1 Tax=Hellea balneolensis TaxID=287478 RepID=UPI000427D7AC|nr:ROK family protein [Hellea balneolensis]